MLLLKEKDIRKYLYDSSGISPIFNPAKKPKKITTPTVIDMSFDVTNTTKLYHPNTDEVRGLLSNADAVVCDNEALVVRARQYTNAVVGSFPFGFCPKADMENNDGLIVGVLNHQHDVQINNQWFQSVLKKLDYKLLVYGDELGEHEVTDDFYTFAARCDILLLPSTPAAQVNSITMPLSVMMAGTAVIASNAAGYSAMNGASGVIVRDGKRLSDWRDALLYLENDSQRLLRLKSFNQKYAKQVSQESVTRMAKLKRRLPQPEPVEAA